MITGRATRGGTAAYASRHPEITYRELGRTGLAISDAGFGGYRVDARVKVHRQALEKALLAGINLADTSANYADGGSERLVGWVIGDLVERGLLQRSEVVVVSKVGYLQGENYYLSQERKRTTGAFPDLVLYDDGLEHCIHPDFLADQLTRSLDRLQLDCIDCYLLHNPEYYLSWAARTGVEHEAALDEYLRRIRLAFEHLEREVQAGRIQCYGISSNTFPKPRAGHDSTPLAAVWDLAESISPQHHFRIVQMPFNLMETGAVTVPNQPGGVSVLRLAHEHGLGVLINRPLNAIQGGQLVRLSEGAYHPKAAAEVAGFRRRIASLHPSWADVPSLSQLSLRVLRATQGVSTVLVGMRQETYVDDVLEELRRPCASSGMESEWAAIRDGATGSSAQEV